MKDNFKDKVADKHGDAFSDPEDIKSGSKLDYSYILNRQIERIGLAEALGTDAQYVSTVNHLERLLAWELKKKPEYAAFVKRQRESIQAALRKVDEDAKPFEEQRAARWLAEQKLTQLVLIVHECGLTPMGDREI